MSVIRAGDRFRSRDRKNLVRATFDVDRYAPACLIEYELLDGKQARCSSVMATGILLDSRYFRRAARASVPKRGLLRNEEGL